VPGTEVLFSIWETRVKDYAAYAAANSGVDGSWKDPMYIGNAVTPGPTYPVVNVNWDDAVAFCRWLTETERKAGRLGAGQEYRLPTDAEWSYAVGIGDRERGSTPEDKDAKLKDVYPWGTGWPPPNGAGNYADISTKRLFPDQPAIDGYEDGYATASPVGSFPANQHGLFDMGGNVWEWCQDFLHGPSGPHVMRGASWRYWVSNNLWSSCRSFGGLDRLRDMDHRGFRVVLGDLVPLINPHRAVETRPRTNRGDEPTARRLTAGELMTNTIGMELVWIAPGKFTMGSSTLEQDHYKEEGPQTEVTLTKGYWLAKYEVTQAEYEAVIGSNPSKWKGQRLPVEQVSWTEAVEFCRKLTEKERVTGRLPAGYEYRLPTEAQWEYACRAGTRTRFGFGDSDEQLGNYAWYDANSGKATHPVGQKQSNAWGLHDMHGNVWEWCVDWLGDYPGGHVIDPAGATSGSVRVERGGSWYHMPKFNRSAYRGRSGPASARASLGFRAALAPVQ